MSKIKTKNLILLKKLLCTKTHNTIHYNGVITKLHLNKKTIELGIGGKVIFSP
jgi:hypothetical protein